MRLLPRSSPASRTHAPGNRAETERLLRRMHVRDLIWLGPTDDIEAVVNDAGEGVSIGLIAGEYDANEQIVIRVPGVKIYGFGNAHFVKSVARATHMFLVVAERVRLDGLWLDDNAGGGGDAIRLQAAGAARIDNCEVVDCYIPGGPGSVQLGAGIFFENADRSLVSGCIVEPSVPARPLGAPGITEEIWLDDFSLKCRVCSNDANGGSISYLGASLSVNDGANIPAVTVR